MTHQRINLSTYQPINSSIHQKVKKIYSDHFPDAFIGEAGNCEVAYARLHERKWDLVVLDINLPGRSGLELIHDIKAFNEEIPVLILSMYNEDQMALRAIKAGALGYLYKARASDELVRASELILGGKLYLSVHATGMLAKEYRQEKNGDLLKQLSDREYFVLLRLAQGETIAGISGSLSLSAKTISTYKSRIMRKLGLKSMVQLIQLVQENGLLNT